MVKKYHKVIINTIFLFIVFGGTAYIVFKDQEIESVIEAVREAKKGYFALGFIFSLLFICSESVIIHSLLQTIRQRIPLLRCVKYSFVGFFFSAVTPSATGGQPMQIVWMKKDKIGVPESTLVLMIVTAAYKIVLLMLSVVAAIFEWHFIQENASEIWFLVIIGVICNVSFILILLLAVFKQTWVTDMIGKSIFWLGKHHIIKDRQKTMKKVWKSLNKYNISTDYIKGNKPMLARVMLITLIQRLSLFAVTYVVYRSFGLHQVSAFQIISLQCIIALAVDSLPLPGAMGASESSFLVMFSTIFGEQFVLPGMLLSRGITYYAMIIISATVTLITHMFGGQKKILESGGK